jgi:DNA invertase Pin-like site-specific DNA recombinase
MRRGVVVKTIINGLTFDSATKDPSAQAVRDALISFMAAMAQAQTEAAKEAQKAGIARAKAGKDKAYRGRKPSFTESQIAQTIALTGEGKGVTQVAKQVGLSRAAIYRILKCPADAYASVRAWS